MYPEIETISIVGGMRHRNTFPLRPIQGLQGDLPRIGEQIIWEARNFANELLVRAVQQ